MKKKTLIIINSILITLVIALVSLALIIIFQKLDANANEYYKLNLSKSFYGKVNEYTETIGTVERNIPTESSNEGLNARYPVYGSSLPNVTDEEKDNLLRESSLLYASNSTFDAIDEKGNLLLNGVKTGEKLYKHTAADNMYYGNVSDDEQAVIEKITITANEPRNYATGIYAPPGELIKIEISSEDLNKLGGKFSIIIGQTSHRNVINNIWKARNDFSRMPEIANRMVITSNVAYVGYCLGGPIYVYPDSYDSFPSSFNDVTFTVTVSGGVKYARYVHGKTTAEEVELMKNYSAPYYDFEIWDLGVRHSGPSLYGNFDYENLVNVGNLWEKIIRTSRQIPCSANASIGVGYVYDCFVAAGAAVAFQGGHSWVNAPCSWMSNALNYNSMVTDGFWGVIHEYNHLYQTYGMESSKTNEVTNNATSLLSYALYTKISEKRSLDDATLSDWNRFTDPSRSLRETLSLQQNGSPQSSLNAYADILHSFGVETFTKAAQAQQGLGVDNWYEALSKVTDYNFTYYFEKILNQTLSDEIKALYDTDDRIPFIPVATTFQTGRNYYDDGKEVYIKTATPFVIEYGKPFIMDFNERLILPNGYTFNIKNVTKPDSGIITEISKNVYEYSPSADETSGVIYLTVELIGEKQTNDVTFTLEFKQRYKNQVDVTKYSFDGETKYATVDEAVQNNFEGYTNKTEYQNASTFINGLSYNQIGVVEGKIYIQTSGNYAFCLRSGRGNNTLYLAVNDKNVRQVLSLNTDHGGFSLSGEHVVNLQLNDGDYVYFKEITLSRHYADAFSELGMANLNLSSPSMKTVSNSCLYQNDATVKTETFTSAEVFKREYSTAKTLTSSNSESHSLVNVNMPNWSDNEKVENIFDGNDDTYYHNNKNNFINDNNPFVLSIDAKEENLYNSITITSRKNQQYNLPSTFIIYGSLDGENWFTVGSFFNLSLNKNTVTADFDDATFRFYKLYVTDTKSQNNGNKYVTISSITLNYVFKGVERSPYELEYYANKKTDFTALNEVSNFGTVIKGNGKIAYATEASAIALITKQSQNCKIRVTVGFTTTEYQLTPASADAIVLSDFTLRYNVIIIEVLEGELCVNSFITK